MGDALKKLGEAELEIMQVIWSCERPVNSNYILKELQERRKWQLSTLMTSLARLAEKGLSIVTVPREATCTQQSSRRIRIRPERARAFWRSCTTTPYRT